MRNFWGYHAMFDCAGCDIASIKSKKVIKYFIKNLVDEIDMVSVGKPKIKYLCKGDPKEGYSFVQLIITSSITGHLMNSGEAYFDVFSCKTYDTKIVEKMIKLYFKPHSMRFNFITRDAS